MSDDFQELIPQQFFQELPRTKEEILSELIFRTVAVYEEAEADKSLDILEELAANLLARLKTAELKSVKKDDKKD
jgi:hypothetical protein